MWSSTRTVAPTPSSAIVQLPLENNLRIEGTHVYMIRENQFDRKIWSNPYRYVIDFIEICNLFQYGENQEEAVKLRTFPFSLTRKAKTLLNELDEGTISTFLHQDVMEDLDRDGECGFDYLTFALVSSKASREGCSPSRGGFPYWFIYQDLILLAVPSLLLLLSCVKPMVVSPLSTSSEVSLICVELLSGWCLLKYSIIPAKYPQLLSEQNKLDLKSFKDKLPSNIEENPMFQRLSRYPISVRVFLDPILFLAGLKPSWEHVNTEPPKDVKEPEVQPAEVTADSGESPNAGVIVVHPGSVAAHIKERKCKTRGGSSRTPVKRKLTSGSSSSRTVRAKTSASKDDAPFLSISNDDEGLPDCFELKDANACHLTISAITPPAWKGHLDNQMDLELLDLHDRCYARQTMVDNVVNRRACEFLQVIEKMSHETKISRRVKGVKANNLKERIFMGLMQRLVFKHSEHSKEFLASKGLLENLDTLEAVIHRVVNTYGVLRMKENELNALKENGSQMHDEILHEHQIKSSVKMQSQDIQINPVQAMDDSLIVSKSSLIEPENNNAFSKSEIETQMQRQEDKVNMREAVDAGLVVTESSGTKPDKQDTSSSSGNYTTQAVDADIGPVNDEEPFAEVQLTALHNILANEQQHTEQSEPSYDTHLLETIDSNTTPTSTNMCHRGGKKQIKSVKETSNEAKVKNNLDVIETINIELEHSVAKLLAANEQLHKENEHLKQTYKELFDSIKKTRIQNKDNSESLISQINQKSVENADLKAQIQEKVFANAALNNELRKLKGNIVDSKFTKASILGKPPLQPSRNHLVVRQPNAFTSERPRISRPRFASQVDEKKDLSKTVTPHYLPKVRESAAAKPHQVNAPNYSRNSHKESYGSNDMVHAYYLEDARKMTQDKTRIPNHRDMASTRAHCTPNACYTKN
ncbi:hypothetical protein Tco_0039584 [Tanacetum coccineum]